MYYYNHRAQECRRTVSEFHYFLGYKGVKVRLFLKTCFAQSSIDAILVVQLADFQANLTILMNRNAELLNDIPTLFFCSFYDQQVLVSQLDLP